MKRQSLILVLAITSVIYLAFVEAKLTYKGRRVPNTLPNKANQSYFSGSGKNEGPSGKKGGYAIIASNTERSGKKERYNIDSNDCQICGPNKKDKPISLRMRYISKGKRSRYQTNDKSTCEERVYPSQSNVTVLGFGMFKDLEDGDEFLVVPRNGFKAETYFKISNDGYECKFHTSCSQPLIAGDQHGPFLILENKSCESDGDDDDDYQLDILIPPQIDCVICDEENKSRPDSLTLRYSSKAMNSNYQDSEKASCRAGIYPDNATITTTTGQTFNLINGDTFTLLPQGGRFGVETNFAFAGTDIDCYIHTSCSAPLILGDKIGPFEIMAGNECNAEAGLINAPIREPTILPTGEPSFNLIPSFAPPLQPTSGSTFKPTPYFTLKLSPELTLEPTFDPTTKSTPRPTFEPKPIPEPTVEFTINPTVKFTPQPTVTTVELTSNPSSKPTPGPTPNPTPKATFGSTFEPTPDPIPKPTPGPTLEPTPKPTPGPTIEPTPKPTHRPTKLPTNQYSYLPSYIPSRAPSLLPSDSCITGTVRLDERGRVVIDINFYYPHLEPLPSDWVGLYPCSDANLDPPFKFEPILWAYTCYNRVCRNDNSAFATGIGSFTFDDDTLPGYGSTGIYKKINDILIQQPGCYKILLNRIDGISAPPYYDICEGNEIQLVDGLTIAPALSISENLIPSSKPTTSTANSSNLESFDSTSLICEQSVSSTWCSVCGKNKYVSNPKSLFTFPGQPSVPCSALEEAGLGGAIQLAQCEYLPPLIAISCGCKECNDVGGDDFAPADSPIAAVREEACVSKSEIPIAVIANAKTKCTSNEECNGDSLCRSIIGNDGEIKFLDCDEGNHFEGIGWPALCADKKIP